MKRPVVERVYEAESLPEHEWKRRYFAKRGYWPDVETVRKRRENQAQFDANEHRLIDRVTGLPRGKKPAQS